MQCGLKPLNRKNECIPESWTFSANGFTYMQKDNYIYHGVPFHVLQYVFFIAQEQTACTMYMYNSVVVQCGTLTR